METSSSSMAVADPTGASSVNTLLFTGHSSDSLARPGMRRGHADQRELAVRVAHQSSAASVAYLDRSIRADLLASCANYVLHWRNRG